MWSLWTAPRVASGGPVPSQIRSEVVFDRSTRSRRAFGQRVRRQFRQVSHFQVVAPRGRRVSVRRHARRKRSACGFQPATPPATGGLTTPGAAGVTARAWRLLTVRRVHGTPGLSLSGVAPRGAKALCLWFPGRPRPVPNTIKVVFDRSTRSRRAFGQRVRRQFRQVSHFQVVAPRGRRVSVRRHARRKRSACGFQPATPPATGGLTTTGAAGVASGASDQIRLRVVFDRSTRSRRAFGQRVRRQFRQVSHFQVVAPRGRRVSVRRHARRKRSACGFQPATPPATGGLTTTGAAGGDRSCDQIRNGCVFDRSTRSRRAFGQRVRRQFRQVSHFQVVAPRGRRVSVRRHARRDAASPVHRPRQTAVGREQPLRAPHAQHPRPGAPDPVEDPQPRVDRAMALTLERGAGQTLSPEQPVSYQSKPPRGTPAECD